ncbi:MAG: helix-hairpin-helix domain-containing protein [Bacteroidales bacterium]|nr:helix-hairpin-helix domain-containing protein [Bacteroidales bacterium]
MRRVILLTLLFSGSGVLFVNRAEGQEIPERIIELITKAAEEGGNIPEEDRMEELLEYYRQMLLSPLNINTADREDLETLDILSDWQVSAIISYREEYGQLLSLNELYNIPGFKSDIVSLLIPFLTVGTKDENFRFSPKSMLRDSRAELLLKSRYVIEKELGFFPIKKEDFDKKPDSRYLGPRGSFYSQLKYESTEHIKAAITLERDPGERGVDYKSLNISISKIGILNRLVAGDFSARFGQGLVLWNSFAMDSYTDVGSLSKHPAGLAPYNSTDENRALRGISATLEKDDWRFTILASHRRYDARVVDGKYTSLLTTGLHNTKTTLERKGSLDGTLIGSNISWSGNSSRISQTTALYWYSLPYGGRDSVKIRHNRQMGGYQANFSIDGYRVFRKFRIFGELAADHTGSYAFIGGLLYSPTSKLETALLLRDFAGQYRAPFASPISRKSSIGGERSVRIAAKLLLGKYWKTTADAEFCNDKYYLTFSASSSEKAKSQVFLKYSLSDKRHSLRYNHTFRLSSLFRIAGRGDLNFIDDGGLKYGYHLSAETIFKAPAGKFETSLRLAYFNAALWDSRIYVYERDMLYNFSVPVYYGEGVRCYLNLHIIPVKRCDIWFRIAATRYLDRDKISEGTGLISGPLKSEAKIQLRFRL